MTTTEIRARVHAALGDAITPAGLTQQVASRLSAPPAPRRPAVRYRVAAGVLAIALVAVLLLTRLASIPLVGQAPAPAFHPNQVVGPVDANQKLPAEDLAAAGLSERQASLVMPLNLRATSNEITIQVIGAYADSAELVLFLRGSSERFTVHASIYDATGLLNFGEGGTSGIAGDWIVTLIGGAHADARGIAHLNVALDSYQADPGAPPPAGTWNFSFDLKVHGPEALTLRPALASIGGWNVKIEAMEATPAVVRFQVLVDAAPEQVSSLKVTLVDSSGHTMQATSAYTMLTNQMFFFIVIGNKQSRLNQIWMRPAAGQYELRISGHGPEYRGTLTIP